MFKSLFGKNKANKPPRGSHALTISDIQPLTNESVKVILSVPDNLKATFQFTPGQYLTFIITLEGKEYRRSYSICSSPDEPLAVGVKQVENGTISTWFNQQAQTGDTLFTLPPEGNFTLPEATSIVAITAGSGITPVLSMAKSLKGDQQMNLFFGNRTEASIMFKDELTSLNDVNIDYYLSGETKDGFNSGRLNKETFTTIIKGNLELLKSDCFVLCGPEEMIVEVNEALELFGVSEDRIKYELFTTPVLLKPKESELVNDFNGNSNVTILLDDEKEQFVLASDGPTILDKANDEGIDAPYSCKGGVCSSCKGKILKGKANMKMNFSLTDKDIEEGYILTCQAHPASEELIISYDE